MEQIDIGALNFDTDKLTKSALETRLQIDQLSSSITESRKVVRESQKAVNELAKENEVLAKSGDTSSKAYKDNEKAIASLNKEIDKSTKSLVEQESTRRNLNKEQREVNKIIDLQTKSQSTNTAVIESANAVLQENWKNQGEAFQIGSAMMALRKQLNPAIAEEAELMAKLAERVDEANEYQDQYNTKNEERIKGVGGYAKAIMEAMGATSKASAGMKGFTNGISGSITGMQGLTGASNAFAATPLLAIVTLLVKGFQFLYKRFGETQEGMDAITKVTRPLMAMFDAFMGIMQKLAVSVGSGLTDAFKNPTKAIKNLGDILLNNVINRFKAFGVIWNSIKKGDIQGAVDGVIQLGTGIEDATKKAQGFIETMREANERGLEEDRIKKDIQRSQIELNKSQKESRLEIAKITEELRDGNKTGKERNELAEKRLAIQQKQSAADMVQLNKQIELMRLENTGSATRLEDETEYQALIDKRNDILQDVQDLATRNRRFQSQADKEDARAQAEAHKEYMKGILDKQKAELELFVLRNEGNQNSLTEELNFYKDVQKQKEEILKQQLKARVITTLEYDTEIAKLEIEGAKKNAEVAVFYATQKVNEEIKTLQTIQAERKRFNDVDFKAEQDLINKIAEERLINAKTSLKAGLMNRHEYNALVLEIETEQQTSITAIGDQFDKQRVEDRKLSRLLEHEAFLLNMGLEWEKEQELLDFQKELELEALEEERDNELISEENYQKALLNIKQNYANKQVEIERLKDDMILEAAAKMFGQMAGLMGDQTELGKFFASAQALISTYLAAQEAFAYGVAIGGPPLGSVFAGIAVATGLKNVAEINKVDTSPKMEQLYTGGKTGDGGMFTRTGYTHAGEVVFNRQDVLSLGGADAVDRLRPTSEGYGTMPTGVGVNSDNITDWKVVGAILGSYVQTGAEAGTNSGVINYADTVDVRRSAIF